MCNLYFIIHPHHYQKIMHIERPPITLLVSDDLGVHCIEKLLIVECGGGRRRRAAVKMDHNAQKSIDEWD